MLQGPPSGLLTLSWTCWLAGLLASLTHPPPNKNRAIAQFLMTPPTPAAIAPPPPHCPPCVPIAFSQEMRRCPAFGVLPPSWTSD
jgi:hypothetical protein